MLPAVALAAVLAAQPGKTSAQLRFDTITPKAAEAPDGRTAAVAFVRATPTYTTGEGNLDAALGCAKLTVRGTLRVVHHPGITIGETFFEPFTEVRLDE